MKKVLFLALIGLIMTMVPMDVCRAASPSGNVAKGKELFNKLVKYADQWDRYSRYDLTSLPEEEGRRAVGVLFEASEVLMESTKLNNKLTNREKEELNNYVSRQLKTNPGSKEKIQRLKMAIEAVMDAF